MIPWKLIMYGAGAALAIGAAVTLYFHIVHIGEQKILDQEKKAYDQLRDATDAAQSGALTTPDPDDRLRKFERPGP